MRVCSLVLALVLGSGTAAFAQNLGGGVKGGLNFTDLNVSGAGAEGSLTDGRIGFIGGLFVQIPVAPQVSIQLEGLYAQKGADLEDPEADDDAESVKLKLDYFEVPVLFRWDSPSGGASKFNLFAGPSFNFNTRARLEAEAVVSGSPEEVDIKDQVEGFDFGIVFGAGAEFGNFLIDGRYHHGLTDINKDVIDNEFNVKNRAFSIMVGFRF